MKKCSHCKQLKDISEFRKNSSYSDGYDCYCVTCRKTYKRKKKQCKCDYDCLNCKLPDCYQDSRCTPKEAKLLNEILGTSRSRLKC